MSLNQTQMFLWEKYRGEKVLNTDPWKSTVIWEKLILRVCSYFFIAYGSEFFSLHDFPGVNIKCFSHWIKNLDFILTPIIF